MKIRTASILLVRAIGMLIALQGIIGFLSVIVTDQALSRSEENASGHIDWRPKPFSPEVLAGQVTFIGSGVVIFLLAPFCSRILRKGKRPADVPLQHD